MFFILTDSSVDVIAKQCTSVIIFSSNLIQHYIRHQSLGPIMLRVSSLKKSGADECHYFLKDHTNYFSHELLWLIKSSFLTWDIFKELYLFFVIRYTPLEKADCQDQKL